MDHQDGAGHADRDTVVLISSDTTTRSGAGFGSVAPTSAKLAELHCLPICKCATLALLATIKTTPQPTRNGEGYKGQPLQAGSVMHHAHCLLTVTTRDHHHRTHRTSHHSRDSTDGQGNYTLQQMKTAYNATHRQGRRMQTALASTFTNCQYQK